MSNSVAIRAVVPKILQFDFLEGRTDGGKEGWGQFHFGEGRRGHLMGGAVRE